ncbi:uncharacterized protein SPPG_05477 [Spizellomyces punctatus DAOM BR117]|uniref:Uncharacterized protein n=1 Tax=Spizellomyces punctatus (strain DAOM BR117) TaxID=645134 RepID=A0A0L0HDY2_SPIPD|nr:uncharacterized protein SPPG_05477 [Spizellomyces punctatus DAOM BR117]KNC99221.1 hypothetical protein SPPG_05477 [Spizellomyces punctatus DAOM BR117]|eukprot:XP_016607261.1 hypothetical protein SPPG_05477 [Spizellomyces punctatus DAOM BR117]
MPSAFLSRIFGKKSEPIHPSPTDSNIPTRTTVKSSTTIVLRRSNSWADTRKGPAQTALRRSHSLTDDDTRRQTWRSSLFKGKRQKKGWRLDGFLPTWKKKQPALANEALQVPQIYLSYHAAVDKTGPYGAPVWLEEFDTADALPKDPADIFVTSGHLSRRRTVHFGHEEVATRNERMYDPLPPTYRYTSFSDSALNRGSPVGSADGKGLMYHSDFHISHFHIPREAVAASVEGSEIEPDTVSLADTLISNQACVGRDCDPVYLFQRRSWALVSNLHGVGDEIRELYADVMGSSMDFGKIVEKWC